MARQSSFAFEFSGLNSSMLWLDGICRCLDAIAGAWPNFKMKIHLHIVSKVLDLWVAWLNVKNIIINEFEFCFKSDCNLQWVELRSYRSWLTQWRGDSIVPLKPLREHGRWNNLLCPRTSKSECCRMHPSSLVSHVSRCTYINLLLARVHVVPCLLRPTRFLPSIVSLAGGGCL